MYRRFDETYQQQRYRDLHLVLKLEFYMALDNNQSIQLKILTRCNHRTFPNSSSQVMKSQEVLEEN